MYHIIYLSSSAVPFEAKDLRALLEKSRRNNAAAGVTGALFYWEGNFLQLIEGEEAAVREIFRRIENDPRHRRVSVLFSEEIERRDFDQWSMAFRDFGKGPVPEGFAAVLNDHADRAALEMYPLKLAAFLRSFVQT